MFDRAIIYSPDLPPTWLNELIPAGTGWKLKSAIGVSEDYHARYISGTGLHDGKQRGYLMVRRNTD